MEEAILLVNSMNCRLCGEENQNGTTLFPQNENEQDLSQLVNKYLPLKVYNDGKLPKTICPGCHIQLEASIQFLDLIAAGQNKLRHLWRIQQDQQRRKEKEKRELEIAINGALGQSSETYTLQTEENGEKIYIQVFSKNEMFPPDHEMTLRVEGLDRPKRKRGRPPKPPPTIGDPEPLPQLEVKEEIQEIEEDLDDDADRRKRRRRKVPTRFKEAVQGKELERMFREEGIINEEDDTSGNDDGEDLNSVSINKPDDDIIGYLENREGEDMGELIVVNKNKKSCHQKGKRKRKFVCDICNRSFLVYGRYLLHKNYHKGVRYECASCNERFASRESLEDHHKEKEHSGEVIVEKLTADDDEVFQDSAVAATTTEAKLEKHEQSEPAKYDCGSCVKKFATEQKLDVHTKATHEGQKLYPCNRCDKSFSYVATLKTHAQQTHEDRSEKNYVCDVCDKRFNHPSSIIYHKEAEHNNGRRFVCNKCDKSFKHKQLLQRHQLVHSDSRPYVCKSCGASFKTRANLMNHQPTHTGEKRYFCTKCGQQFAHKTSLTLHYRWHDGQKPYECTICNKRFSQKGNFQEHRRIHTGEKPFCCDYCGRKFTTSSQFKLHVKRHTGERPWRCEYCSKTFLHKDTWKCHTRRHRNERPYQCTQCIRGFTEQWALKKHMRLHTGEKPYVCEICDKAFADCSNLTKHRKIHVMPELVRKNATNGETQQYIYVTYQDSNSNDGQTLVHFLDEGKSEDNGTASPQLTLDYSLLQSGEDCQDGTEDAYIQVTDEDGNPINITTSDGQQIKVTTMDGQNLNGLLPDGTVVPISLTQDGKAVALQLLGPDDTNGEEMSGTISTVTDESDNVLNGTDDQPQAHFVTNDGQNVCLITSYNIEDEALPPEYLSIN